MSEKREFLWLTNPKFEEEQCLMENGEIILTGDYYHDKISAQIEGFIRGVKYAGMKVKVTKKRKTWDGCYDYDE